MGFAKISVDISGLLHVSTTYVKGTLG